MRHRKKNKILNRPKGPRQALIKSLVINFILNKKIKTTQAKAKVARSVIEKLITKAKTDNLTTRRYLMRKLNHSQAVNKLIKDIALKHKTRKGGYTRLTKLGFRKGDGAPLVQIELIQNDEQKQTK